MTVQASGQAPDVRPGHATPHDDNADRALLLGMDPATPRAEVQRRWSSEYGNRTVASVRDSYTAQARRLNIPGNTLAEILTNARSRLPEQHPARQGRVPLGEVLATLQGPPAPPTDSDRVVGTPVQPRASRPTNREGRPGGTPAPARHASPPQSFGAIADPAARATAVLTAWDALPAANTSARRLFAERLLRELNPEQLAELPHRNDLAELIEELRH